MYQISLSQQMLFVLSSFVVGIVFAVFYDVFRIARNLVKTDSIIIFVEDVIYCTVCTAVYIIFIYAVNFGIPRLFSAIATVLGFFFYYFTVGTVFVRFGTSLVKMLLAFLSKMFCVIRQPILLILGIFAQILKYILGIITICVKKLKNHFIFAKKQYIINLYIKIGWIFKK